MNYGKGAMPGVAGVAVLPFTGSNNTMLILAASLIVLGVGVFVVSLVLARTSRQTSVK